MTSPTFADAIVSVEREIAMRHAVYPKRVALRKMTQAKADWEIACMELVLANLHDITQFLSPNERLDHPTERTNSTANKPT